LRPYTGEGAFDTDEDAAAAGALLGALLLSANAPALTQLDVCSCALRDAGLRPLFAALARNSHLRELRCAFNGLSKACARDALLPAVRACASLRALWADRDDTEDSGKEACRIVSAAAPRGGAGAGQQ
jgi:hypothetical protein